MIEQRWAKLRREGETATLTRDLLLEALSEFAQAATRDFGNAMQGRRTQNMEAVRERIEALPDYSEDQG